MSVCCDTKRFAFVLPDAFSRFLHAPVFAHRSSITTPTVLHTITMPSLAKDPYVLAHEYHAFMQEKPEHWLQQANPYYLNLLANRPDPADGATDAMSRAIRYAKEHYECYYEPRDVPIIVEILDRKAAEAEP
jgi:hypothetical protein